MNDLQSCLLDIAIAFDAVCRKNELKYYMLGGTMLGAIRHRGFIPWDDDMDFGMPRKDYEKLIQLYQEHSFPEHIEMDFYLVNSESPFHYIKIIDNRTTLIENNYQNHVEGLYIDIFPLDGSSNLWLLAKLNSRIIRVLHASLMNHYSTSSKACFPKKMFKLVSSYISPNYLHKQLDYFLKFYSFETSTIISNYLGAWGYKETMNKYVFGNPKEYSFEDISLFGVENAHDYLTYLYNDYQVLPDKKNRTPKHNYYYLNLSYPYKDYQKMRDIDNG